LFFDGSRYKGEFRDSKAVRVSFSKSGQTADEWIHRFISTIVTKERLLWILVSNDSALRDYSIASGLRVKRPEELANEMKELTPDQPNPNKKVLKEPFNNPFYYKL